MLESAVTYPAAKTPHPAAKTPPPSEELAVTFAELGLEEKLLRTVADEGYEVPTPVQAQAIPHLLEGRDLLGRAQVLVFTDLDSVEHATLRSRDGVGYAR